MGVDTTVKGILTAHTVLSGAMTTPDGAILGENDRCLVVGQSDPIDNGVYYVHTTAWTRDLEFHLYPAVAVRIFSGNTYKHSEWILNAEADVIPGVGVQSWTLDRLRGAAVPGAGMSRDVDGHIILANTGVTPGTYQNPNITVGADGRLSVATSSNIIRTYIEGLELQYVSTTQIRVLVGSAYIPGLGKIVELNAQVTLSPSLAADTSYYVYLYDVNGVGQIEVSTTAYSSPYLGNARTKNGDTTRRYLGDFTTNSSAQIDSTLVNSHNLASTQFPGEIELATLAEAQLGLDATRALSPYVLAQRQFAPIGAIIMWGGLRAGNPPTKWSRCLGQSALRTDFPELFALIGTTYGQGSAPGTTFAFPDLTARFPLGASVARDSGTVGGEENHILTAAELPPHSHTLYAFSNNNTTVGGSADRIQTLNAVGGGNTSRATDDGPGTSTAHNNMPPYQTLMFIIRSLP